MALGKEIGGELLKELIKKIPEWILGLLKAWFRMFWRASAVGKLILTVVEIIALNFIVSSLHLPGQLGHSIVAIGGLVLMFLLIFGVLVAQR